MDVMHERVAGLDVLKTIVVACVRLLIAGKVVRECRTFETTTAELLELLAWLTACGCSHVAMEATGVYWRPVWNILSEGDFELILANAANIKNVPGRKTDVNNAMWIADLVACGLIKASFVALYASCPQQKCSRNHGPIASSVLIGARKSSSSLFREHLYPTLTPFDRMML